MKVDTTNAIDPSAAISAHRMLSDIDGSAPCHQPFTTKPAAPKRFIHWNAGDCPVSRPVVTSR